MATYDQTFYESNRRMASHAASTIVPLVADLLKPASVVDFGCAQGTWLAEWLHNGVTDIAGLDGDFVDVSSLVIDRDLFSARDLSAAVDLGRRFDLAQSLEVAEHIPETSAVVFVENLARHADRVLFSAAPPGQGGVNHVNERPYGYWRDIFAEHGYSLFDCIRPAIAHDRRIQPWYRYNVFLYVKDSAVAALPGSVREHALERHEPVADISPGAYKLRKAILRHVPQSAQRQLAKLKRIAYSNQS